jgi:hypothetical protein
VGYLLLFKASQTTETVVLASCPSSHIGESISRDNGTEKQAAGKKAFSEKVCQEDAKSVMLCER